MPASTEPSSTIEQESSKNDQIDEVTIIEDVHPMQDNNGNQCESQNPNFATNHIPDANSLSNDLTLQNGSHIISQKTHKEHSKSDHGNLVTNITVKDGFVTALTCKFCGKSFASDINLKVR